MGNLNKSRYTGNQERFMESIGVNPSRVSIDSIDSRGYGVFISAEEFNGGQTYRRLWVGGGHGRSLIEHHEWLPGQWEAFISAVSKDNDIDSGTMGFA